MRTKILVTGAAGFIGSHLVDFLLDDGVNEKDLRVLVKPGEPLQNLPNKKFEIVIGDIRRKKVVEKVIDGINVIYHLAAKTVFEGNSYRDFKDTNVDGTRNLLEAIKNKKIKKFVFFSSISVYGLPAFSGARINCDESWSKVPSEPYGKSKLEAEKLVLDAHKDWGIPYVIIRPTTVYGPRDHQGILELYRAIYHRYFFRIGDGRNRMDYVYVKDLVRGARQAEKSKIVAEDFILGANQPITMREIVDLVAKSINRETPNFYLPKNLALPVSYIVSLLGKILGARPPLFPERVKVMTTTCYFNSTKAKKLISYNPKTTFKEGTIVIGKWLLKNKLL